MIKRLFTVGLLCAGTAVLAQTVLGRVAEVQGVVTISDGVTVGTATPGSVIMGGTRFVTASSGAARLTMENGCVISLKPNESLTVGSGMSCQELLAAVQPVAGAPVVAGGGGAGLGPVLAGGALLAAAGLAGGGGGTGAAPGGGGGIPVTPISGQ